MLASYASGTLSKLKRAADLFSGMEKQGVHAIAQANENIVDVEIMLDATDLPTARDYPRIDIAAFEQRSDGVELVFWEAKLFANKELRASGSCFAKSRRADQRIQTGPASTTKRSALFVPPRRQESRHNCRNERRRPQSRTCNSSGRETGRN